MANKTMANSAVTGLATYKKVTSWVTLLLGVVILFLGIYVMTLPDIDVTVIKASVTSVTWNDKDDCGVTSSSNKGGESSVVYHCDVVTKYKEDDADKAYEFYSASKTRYKSGDEIDLYKFDGIVSQLDPNAWKSIRWIAFIVGAILVLWSLFSLLACSWNKTLCAILGGASILENTLH